MYQHSPVLGAMATMGLVVGAVAVAAHVVIRLVDHYWIPQNPCDEPWLYGEDAVEGG